jgi:hypothetical protein
VVAERDLPLVRGALGAVETARIIGRCGSESREEENVGTAGIKDP